MEGLWVLAVCASYFECSDDASWSLEVEACVEMKIAEAEAVDGWKKGGKGGKSILCPEHSIRSPIRTAWL